MTEAKPEPLIPDEIHEKIMAYLAATEAAHVRVLGEFRLLNAPSLTQAAQAFWEAATNEHERKHAERNGG